MLWSLIMLPLLLAPAVYLHGRGCGRAGLTLWATLSVLATLALVAVAVANGWSGSYRWSDTLALTLQLSAAGAVFAVTVPLIALPVIVYAGYHDLAMADDGRRVASSDARLLALLVAFVAAMELLVLANDLLTLLVAWELVGACSWALIGHRWGAGGIPRAAARAFLVTRFGDLGLYIAAAAVFAGSGGFGYADLGDLDGSLLGIAVAGIVLAAAAKSAQLPFASWLFAAMAGPVPVSALLHAATMVAAGTYLLVRLQPVLDGVVWFAPLVIAIGLTTALSAGVVAVSQDHAKKLLAASTSSHYGLMWLAVGAGFPGVALVHFVTHAFMKAGLFLSVGLAERETGSYALAGMRLGRRLPGVATTTLVSSLALAGMVPLGSAWSKEQIASAAAQQSIWLALLVALAGGLSALYAMRFQCLAYGRPGRQIRDRLPASPAPSPAELGALRALVVGTVLLSVLWWPPAQRLLGGWLGVQWPPGQLWLLGVSLALVLAGMAGGVMMSRPGHRRRRLAWQAIAADWFGLLGLTQGIATQVSRFSACLAHFDDAIVDAGLSATARFGAELARFNATRGEALAEGLPNAFSRLANWGGHWARRAQSGQTHHYYSGIAAGLAFMLIVLLAGALL